ncbi:MAG: hypothetical protein ACRDJ4_05325 [Actinomycetota bacterium]
MAGEMGLYPRSLIKNIPSPKEPWKAPGEDWIREVHEGGWGQARGRGSVVASPDGSPAI